MTSLLTAPEAQTATHKRDGEPVGQFEVRFTDPKAFVQDLKADHRLGAIEHNVVRLAIVNGPANDGQVDVAFRGQMPAPRVGDRHNPLFRSKYVEAAYQARGQLIKLSCFCGIAPVDDAPAKTQENAATITEATAQAIQGATRIVQAVLQQLEDVETRGGGFYVQDGAWTAWPDSPIEAPPSETCGVCGVAIHYSNGAWRDESMRSEITVDAGFRPGTRVMRKRLDHVHLPAGGAL
jgi:hypothetical protein